MTLATILPLAHAWASGGWVWRFGELSTAAEQLVDLDALRDASIRFNHAEVLGASFTTRKRHLLVVGDSHARDVSNGLVQSLDGDAYEVRLHRLDDVCLRFLPASGGKDVGEPDGLTDVCRRELEIYRGSLKIKQADVVLISANFTPERASHVDRWVAFTRAVSGRSDQKFVLLDRTVTFAKFHPEALRILSGGGSIDDVNLEAGEFARNPFLGRVTDVLESRVEALDGVEVVSKRDYVCGADRCSFFLDDGTLGVWDDTHWTVDGARVFMAALVAERPELFE